MITLMTKKKHTPHPSVGSLMRQPICGAYMRHAAYMRQHTYTYTYKNYTYTYTYKNCTYTYKTYTYTYKNYTYTYKNDMTKVFIKKI